MPRKFHNRRQIRPAGKARFGLPLKPAAAILFALVAVFGAGYLIQINAAASKGYQIRTLENQISDLKTQSGKLEIQVAQEQSVQAVENKVQDLGMVPTPNVEYLRVNSPIVAQR